MSPSLLAALAVLLLFAGAWEAAGSHGEEVGAALRRLAPRLPPAQLARKAACVAAASCVALIAAPAAPGRTAILVALALPAAGFIAPDALRERAARRRRARLVAALPDALDLMAAGAASGSSLAATLSAVAHTGDDPFSIEFRTCAAEIACGGSATESLQGLRDRVGGPELAAVVAALDRSQRYGSPLADQLRTQSTSLRIDQQRLIEERAARAAPKIQLVIALVLVPSVLLMIVAALLGNSGSLTGFT